MSSVPIPPPTWGRIATVATCNLNQWAMDFVGNRERIALSVSEARARGARYRLGPELEIPGYGCEDHFLEDDTVEHSWEVLAGLIEDGCSDDMLLDVGLPVLHRGVRYNCRAFVLNRQILLVRPKRYLANDGNYREPRYFAAWDAAKGIERVDLPPCILAVARPGGQVDGGGAEASAAAAATSAPFGDAYLHLDDARIASETCEELFTPGAPHVEYALGGVEIIANGSGSHHSLRKLSQRLDLIRSATAKAGGVYLYANQQGCDGGRLYYDGCATVAVNGDLVAQGSQFSCREVETVVASVDLNQVASYRGGIASLQAQAAASPTVPSVRVRWSLCTGGGEAGAGGGSPGASAASPPRLPPTPSPRVTPYVLSPQAEIGAGPACWLWDYLRRSGASGYILPLSGGADSAATAAIVASMCRLAVQAARDGDAMAARDVRRLARVAADAPLPTPAQLCRATFSTVYLGTANSSDETRLRAKAIAEQAGARHLETRVDAVVAAVVGFFVAATGRTPRFKAHGGSPAENLALQNIQARSRMVVTFVLAQLLPWSRGESGFLLVLGSANVDETLRGYLTKYDCSAADVNPIGGVSKTDLRAFLFWAAERLDMPALAETARAAPTAELEPLAEGGRIAQTDEQDMGMTYAELSAYGRLRKVARMGPVSVFRTLLRVWGGDKARGDAGDASDASDAPPIRLTEEHMWGEEAGRAEDGARAGSDNAPGSSPAPSRDAAAAARASESAAATPDLSAPPEGSAPSAAPVEDDTPQATATAAAPPRLLSPSEIAAKVKFFFRMYSINRHKTTVLPPSYHAESYSPDDNRFDHRQFLYETHWKHQFQQIDRLARQAEEERAANGA